MRFSFRQLRSSPVSDLVGGNDSEFQTVRHVLRLADRKKDRVVMQVKAVVALTVFYVEGHSQAFEKAFMQVVRNLAAAIMAIRTKIPNLSSVSERLAVTFVIGKTVEAEFKSDDKLLLSDVKREFKGL